MDIRLPTALEAEIYSKYNHTPFHNWTHWKVVWKTMRILEDDYTCISPWEMAWYFHDAGHIWIANSPADEERSARMAEEILSNYWWFSKWYIDEVKFLIMWTIFPERWKIEDHWQKLLADADISHLWKDYSTFIHTAIAYLLEQTPYREDLTDEVILDFFKNEQIWFFNYLTDISWNENNPFLTKEASKFFPYFSRNKDILARHVEENPEILIQLTRNSERNWYDKKFRNIFW